MQCDLDFQASDMILAWDTSSYHVNNYCQIILKSYHVGHSYGSDTICVTLVYAISLHAQFDLDLLS